MEKVEEEMSRRIPIPQFRQFTMHLDPLVDAARCHHLGYRGRGTGVRSRFGIGQIEVPAFGEEKWANIGIEGLQVTQGGLEDVGYV